MTSNKTVTKAAGLMMVAILLSRLLGLFRDMAIASKFGQGALVSAYTVAFNLPDLLYFFLSSGALSGAFIPVFTEYYHTDRKKEAWQIFSTIACFMGLVMLGAIALSEIFAVPLVKALAAPGYANDQEMISLIVFLTRVILPCQLFFFMGGLMMGTLESRQNFKARAAGPVIYNLGIIFGVLVLANWFSIAGLAWGALIGAFAGNIAFTFYHLKREGFEFHPNLNLRHPGVKRVGALALPVILGLSLPQIDVIINRYFATFLGEVAPAALNYANRLMQVPLGVFAQAAGTAILPTLAAYAARNAIGELRSAVSFGLRAILAINIPASVFMVVMADPIVRAVYMGGEFTAADVAPTEAALVFYSVGIFAWAGQAIVARGFFAMQDTLTPIVLGSVVTFVFLPLNIILMRVMGHAGLAFATSITATIHLLGLIVLLRKRINGLEGRRILNSAVRVIAASAVIALLCIGVRLQMSRMLGSWQLQDGDIKDAPRLAAVLQNQNNPASSYLRSALTDDTRQMSADYARAVSMEQGIKEVLASELNGIIADPELYTNESFASLHLPSTTQKLLDTGETTRLNRGLIEAALPGVFSTQQEGWLASLAGVNRKESTRNGDRWLIRTKDIRDLPRLSASLQDPNNKTALYIMGQLSPETRNLVQRYHQKIQAASGLSLNLQRDLNSVIVGGTLYTKVETTDTDSSTASIARANRRALETQYPESISRRPAVRVEGRMASAVTVLVAMFLSGLVYLGLLRLFRVEEADFLWEAVRRRFHRGTTAAKDEA